MGGRCRQLANPCSGGGANKESLYACQKLVESWSKEKMAAFERDPNWRPLNEDEVAYFQSAKKREHWAFMGETAPDSRIGGSHGKSKARETRAEQTELIPS